MQTNITNLKSEDSVSSNTSSSPSEITLSKSNSSSKSAIRRLYRRLSSPKGNNEQQKFPTPLKANSPNRECYGNLIQRVFAYFDENGDGKISAVELESCVRAVGGELTPEEAELAVRSSDSDGDGELGIEDFTKLMEARGEEERDVELKEAFGMYVTKGDDCITPTSLKRMLSRLGESASINTCKAMIQKFDLNGDGVLNFDEFRVMMH